VAAMSPDLLRNGEGVRGHAVQYLAQIHAAMTSALTPTQGAHAAMLAWHIMSAATGGLILARLMGGATATAIEQAVLQATSATATAPPASLR
jgi:hypothetical protein